jgi:hypothetical protein
MISWRTNKEERENYVCYAYGPVIDSDLPDESVAGVES